LASIAESESAGGGGGYSLLEQTPYYQQGVSGVQNYSAVPYLTPTDPQNIYGSGVILPTAWNFNATPSVITGSNTGRATPDLATDADPNPGTRMVRVVHTDHGQRLPRGRLGWHEFRRSPVERFGRVD